MLIDVDTRNRSVRRKTCARKQRIGRVETERGPGKLHRFVFHAVIVVRRARFSSCSTTEQRKRVHSLRLHCISISSFSSEEHTVFALLSIGAIFH